MMTSERDIVNFIFDNPNTDIILYLLDPNGGKAVNDNYHTDIVNEINTIMKIHKRYPDKALRRLDNVNILNIKKHQNSKNLRLNCGFSKKISQRFKKLVMHREKYITTVSKIFAEYDKFNIIKDHVNRKTPRGFDVVFRIAQKSIIINALHNLHLFMLSGIKYAIDYHNLPNKEKQYYEVSHPDWMYDCVERQDINESSYAKFGYLFKKINGKLHILNYHKIKKKCIDYIHSIVYTDHNLNMAESMMKKYPCMTENEIYMVSYLMINITNDNYVKFKKFLINHPRDDDFILFNFRDKFCNCSEMFHRWTTFLYVDINYCSSNIELYNINILKFNAYTSTFRYLKDIFEHFGDIDRFFLRIYFVEHISMMIRDDNHDNISEKLKRLDSVAIIHDIFISKNSKYLNKKSLEFTTVPTLFKKKRSGESNVNIFSSTNIAVNCGKKLLYAMIKSARTCTRPYITGAKIDDVWPILAHFINPIDEYSQSKHNGALFHPDQIQYGLMLIKFMKMYKHNDVFPYDFMRKGWDPRNKHYKSTDIEGAILARAIEVRIAIIASKLDTYMHGLAYYIAYLDDNFNLTTQPEIDESYTKHDKKYKKEHGVITRYSRRRRRYY